MRINHSKQIKIKSLIFVLTFTIFSSLLMLSLNNNGDSIKNALPNNDIQEKNAIVNDELPKQSSSYSHYVWWNGDWRFRVLFTTNRCQYEKMDVHVYTTINFTKYMKQVGVQSEPFDVYSIRLVEYLSANNFRETPYKINSTDPQNPSKIQIVWILNGTTPKETSRIYYLYFDTTKNGPKTAPQYETLFSGTRAKYENKMLAVDDQSNWYTWTDTTTQLTHAQSLSSTDGTYITGNNAFRSDSNDHFTSNNPPGSLISYPPFNFTVGDTYTQIRYIDVWWYYMGSSADISLQLQDDGAWAKRWGFDCGSSFDSSYNWPREGNYINQSPNKWRFYRLDLIDQLHLAAGSYITGLAFSADNGDVIYDHIMFEKYNTTKIIIADKAEKKTAEITIITKDVDGQIISGAEVYLLNLSSTTPIVKSGITNSLGTVVFENVSYGVYNITANYSLPSGLKQTVYDSSALSIEYNITTLYPLIYLKLNLWTIDFKVQDRDKKDISLGYINVQNDTTRISLANLTLDEYGRQKFIWLNQSSYYYKAYYRNNKYLPPETLISQGTITRKADRYNSTTIYVNQANMYASTSPEYKVDESFLVESSNKTSPYPYEYDIGFQTIISFNVSLQNMEDNMTSVNIWYIDINGNDDGSTYLIYSHTYIVNTSDFISMNLSAVKEAYGIRIEAIGKNRTTCNGMITVAFAETQTVYINANMSSKDILITDDTSGSPVPGVIVKITNASNGNSIVNLTTNSMGLAIDSSVTSEPLWYLRGSYNISLEFFNTEYYLNISVDFVSEATIALDSYSILDVEILLNINNFKSAFNNTVGPTAVTWGQNMAFQVNFTISDTGGTTWKAITPPASVTYYVKTLTDVVLLTGSMDPQINGNYSKILNSSVLSGNAIYKFVVFGYKGGYLEPIPYTFVFSLNPSSTGLSVLNYATLTSYSTNEVSVYWNEAVNLTVIYYKAGQTTALLKGATLSYQWQYGSGYILQDPLKAEGYYSFKVNTSLSPNTGKYRISIAAELQNYTTITNFGFDINILLRTTRLNGTTTLLHNSTIIWINDSYTWIYKYVDTDTGNVIGNLESVFYYWYKIDAEGKPIGKTSANIDLENATGNVYVLDFNTENREVGSYALFITFQKNNYEARNAFIDLTIEYRTFRASLTATGKEGLIITRVKGQPIVLSLSLTDLSKSSSASSGGTVSTQVAAPLTKATVKLSIAGLGKTYKFTEVKSGVYNLTIETTDPAYQAFFAPQTLVANITIEKENYVTQVIDITIVVDMDQWIPGFPAFYLLMIIIGVGAVVGSLVTYRYIQLAKIPRFVKIARAMKKSIKLSEPISESLVYPSKKEYMAKVLGARFDDVGVSLDTVLGIEHKKVEIKPELREDHKKSLEKKLKSFVKKKEKKPESKENVNNNKGGVA